MLKVRIVCCAVLVCASLAAAQVPTSGNVFFGYSYNNADLSSFGRSNLNGWTASLEGRVFPHVGLVTDFSQTFGNEKSVFECPALSCPTENISAHEYNILFGPRVSLSVGKLRPFAEALFGVGHVSTNVAGSNTSFATGLGGGVDYRIFHPIALRIEGDYLQTRFSSTTQNNLRLSTGIAFRF
jgi:opacity protein-like surface antigen